MLAWLFFFFFFIISTFCLANLLFPLTVASEQRRTLPDIMSVSLHHNYWMRLKLWMSMKEWASPQTRVSRNVCSTHNPSSGPTRRWQGGLSSDRWPVHSAAAQQDTRWRQHFCLSCSKWQVRVLCKCVRARGRQRLTLHPPNSYL